MEVIGDCNCPIHLKGRFDLDSRESIVGGNSARCRRRMDPSELRRRYLVMNDPSRTYLLDFLSLCLYRPITAASNLAPFIITC